MAIIHLTKDSYESEVLNSEKTVLIDFYADWCGPCKMLSPFIEEIAEENEDIKVCKVNVDKEPELTKAFNISSIPMLAVMKNGKLANSAIGFMPKEDILDLL